MVMLPPRAVHACDRCCAAGLVLLEVSVLVFLLQGHLISGHEVRPHSASLCEGIQCGKQQMPPLHCEQLCRLCRVRLRSTSHTNRALTLFLADAGAGAELAAVGGICGRREFALRRSHLWGKGAAVPLRVSAPVLHIHCSMDLLNLVVQWPSAADIDACCAASPTARSALLVHKPTV